MKEAAEPFMNFLEFLLKDRVMPPAFSLFILHIRVYLE